MIKRHITNHLRHNLIAYLALFVALGGTSYAATVLPKNSVGPDQIRPGAVDSSKVKNHSLLAVDLAPGTIPAPPAGASATFFTNVSAVGFPSPAVGVKQVTKTGVGTYLVTFNQLLAGCAPVVTLSSLTLVGFATEVTPPTVAGAVLLDTVLVQTYSFATGALIDSAFSIAVFC